MSKPTLESLLANAARINADEQKEREAERARQAADRAWAQQEREAERRRQRELRPEMTQRVVLKVPRGVVKPHEASVRLLKNVVQQLELPVRLYRIRGKKGVLVKSGKTATLVLEGRSYNWHEVDGYRPAWHTEIVIDRSGPEWVAQSRNTDWKSIQRHLEFILDSDGINNY